MGRPAHGRGNCPKEQTMLSRNPRLLTPGPLALAPEIKASHADRSRVSRTSFSGRSRGYPAHDPGPRRRRAGLHEVPVQGSGTFAIEAALTTLEQGTDKVLVCVNGVYGETAARSSPGTGCRMPWWPTRSASRCRCRGRGAAAGRSQHHAPLRRPLRDDLGDPQSGGGS